MTKQRFPGKVPEAVVRATAVEVFVLAALSAAFASPWPALILTVDFAARGFIGTRFSLLSLVSREVWVPALRLSGAEMFYTPKRFAALIGFMLAAAGTVLLFFGQSMAGAGIIGVLALFSMLEGAFGFCVGCKMFGFLAGKGWLDDSDCPNCAY